MDILYWADGTWIHAEEYCTIQYSWKSDDFGRVAVPTDATDEDIDTVVRTIIN